MHTTHEISKTHTGPCRSSKSAQPPTQSTHERRECTLALTFVRSIPSLTCDKRCMITLLCSSTDPASSSQAGGSHHLEILDTHLQSTEQNPSPPPQQPPRGSSFRTQVLGSIYFQKQRSSHVWGCTLVILAHRKWKQKHQEFKDLLGSYRA